MALVTVEVVPSARGRAQLAVLRQAFVDLGFQLGPEGPASFSITATDDVFQRAFTNVNLSTLPPQLPAASLPKTLRPLVELIVCTTGYVPFTP